jgi:hypothetical protein
MRFSQRYHVAADFWDVTPFTTVSEEPTVCICIISLEDGSRIFSENFVTYLRPWRWRQKVYPKH